MFSLFKNLKKAFLEEWKTFENRVFESHTFNILKEKYQSLSLFHQKLMKYCFLLCLFFLLAYLPVSYFLSSRAYWSDFQEQQELSIELAKMRNKISNSLFRLSRKELKSRIEDSIDKYSNEEFQIKEKKIPLPDKSIYQVDFDIRVKHINIKQVFRLGTELSALSQSRLKFLTMEEDQKYPKHYNVVYALSSFFSKEKPASLRKRQKPKQKRRRGKKSKGRLDIQEKNNLPMPGEIKKEIKKNKSPKNKGFFNED